MLRRGYRRELKKVTDSCKSGTGTAKVYKPILWYYSIEFNNLTINQRSLYYSEIDFLRNQEIQVPGMSSMDTEAQEKESESHEVSEYILNFCF